MIHLDYVIKLFNKMLSFQNEGHEEIFGQFDFPVNTMEKL